MPQAAAGEGQVGIYIDFDNIVMSRYDELHGHGSFRDDNAGSSNPNPFVKRRLAEARVDISAIVDYASSYGTVSINRAYANWSAPANADYSSDLLFNSVDLVQMFNATGTKNGADIRLAIDVIDDLSRHQHLTHVVIVAGDSDYISLAQRCKRLGRGVIGIGAAKSVSRYFRAACDEFRLYGRLPGLTVPVATTTALADPQAPTPPDDASEALLVRAATLIAAKSAEDWFPMTTLKTQMRRLDPTFDETTLGFANFSGFLRSRPSVIEVRTSETGSHARLIGKYATLAEAEAAEARAVAEAEQPRTPQWFQVRSAFGITNRTPIGGSEWERASVAALRSGWAILSRNTSASEATDGYERPPAAEILVDLSDTGLPGDVARRAIHMVYGLLPFLVRDDKMMLQPNRAYSSLDDQALLRVLRQSLASRAQHKFHPEAVTPEMVAEAIFDDETPPDGALEDYAGALTLAPVQLMSQTLSPVLVPAPLLWDVASALTQVGADAKLTTVDALAEALRGPLAELERHLETVPWVETFQALISAGVLTGDADGRYNSFAGRPAEDIAGAVVVDWSSRLRETGQLAVDEPMSMESFYRIVLPDRSRATWRDWALKLADRAK